MEKKRLQIAVVGCPPSMMRLRLHKRMEGRCIFILISVYSGCCHKAFTDFLVIWNWGHQFGLIGRTVCKVLCESFGLHECHLRAFIGYWPLSLSSATLSMPGRKFTYVCDRQPLRQVAFNGPPLLIFTHLRYLLPSNKLDFMTHF